MADKTFIADKETQDEILANTQTIDANVDSVNANVDTVKTNVATINTNVNTINTRTASMQSTLNTVNTNTSRGGVKAVHRGSLAMTTSSASASIPSINTSKSLLIFSFTLEVPHVSNDSSNLSAEFGMFPRGRISSSTSLVFNRNTGASGYKASIEWQVIEYY